MWKALELLCCQRPRTNFTKARDRGLAGETRSERPEDPDSFVFGQSIALADEAICADSEERHEALISNSKNLRSDSNEMSQGSTTPEGVICFPDEGSTASESEEVEEATSKVATAMLRHWRQSESFTQAKLVQALAGRLQITAKKYEAGTFSAKAKERFFVIIGQEAFLGGLNLQKDCRLVASSLELAWFKSKAAYTEHQAPAGSIPLHQVRDCSTGAPASRHPNLEDSVRGQTVVVSSLGPSGPHQLEVVCESKQMAEYWSRDLQDLVAMVRH